VRASLELSYRELNAPDAELFYHMGILEGKDFIPAFAGMLIGKEGNSSIAEDGLERLVDAQLVEALEGHRYQFHDLIRVFAREKLAKLVTCEQQESIKQKILGYLIEWSVIS
jgi:hypothetical protein